MDSIGERLRSIRENKKITIKDVAKDTNISAIYLQALEEENFDKFPGETYIIGFIRSYAEYLKIDAEEIIQAYKGYKIGESVTPLEELTKPTSNIISADLNSIFAKYKNILFMGIAGAALVVIIMLISLIPSTDVDIDNTNSITQIKNEYKDDKDNKKNLYESIIPVNFQDEKGSVLVYKKEAIQFLVDQKEIMFVISEIDKEKKTTKIIALPSKAEEILESGIPKTIKLDDLERDVTFTLKALTPNRAKIALELGKKNEKTANDITDKSNLPNNNKNIKTSNVVARNIQNLKIVFEAKFIGKTYMEIMVDGQSQKGGLMLPGEYKKWEAKHTIQMKIGNAGGVKAVINKKPYVFGKIGQVANKVIKWKKDIKNPNIYHIVVKDW